MDLSCETRVSDSRTPKSGEKDIWLRGPMTRVLKPGEKDSREKEMSMGPGTSEGPNWLRSGKTRWS